MTPKTPLPTQEKAAVENAFGVLDRHASELFDDPKQAAALKDLLAQARSAQIQTAPLAPDTSGSSLEPLPPDYAPLEELVHAVTRIEDTIQDVRHAADVVLDWIAKGGRSLGLD
jgi:hypothetical protein